MTRKNKCDACRKAKIKCDESQPWCLQCIHRGKECTHNWANRDLAFVQVIGEIVNGVTNLGLEVQQRTAATGPVVVSPRSKVRLPRGTHCLPSTSSINIVRNDLFYRRSEGSSLLARWISTIVAAGAVPCGNLHGYGDWMAHIPQYIGNSRPIDHAVKCLIDSRLVFINPNERTRQAVRSSSRAAATSIAAILEDGSRFFSGDILLAIQTLYMVECILKHIATSMTHADGLLALLKQYRKQLKASGIEDDAISREILLYNAMPGVLSALIARRNHALDDPEWLNYPLPTLSVLGIQGTIVQEAASNNVRVSILIPRLALLIHQLAASPGDAKIERAALEVAQELLSLRLDDILLAETISSGQFRYEATTHPSLVNLVPTSYGYITGRLVMLLRSCWLGRLFVCGLVDTLMGVSDLAAESINATEVYAEDVRVCTDVLMSIQSALARSKWGDFVIQRIQDGLFLSLLMMSYGTWERAERRTQASPTGGHEELAGGAPRASRLRELTFDHVRIFQDLVQNPLSSKQHLEDIIAFMTARPTGLRVVVVDKDKYLDKTSR